MNQNQQNLNEMLDSIKMEHFDNVDELKSKCFQIFILQGSRAFSWKHFLV